MRRSKAGSAPRDQGAARGNFTPPSPAAASAAPRPGGPHGAAGPGAGPAGAPVGAAGGEPPDGAGPRGGGSRFRARNWRVPTRLNAILLLPVVVALIFGGFKVESDFSTWREAGEAQRTAKLVAAASDYADAIVDERDRSAAPLLRGDKDDSEVSSSRNATDQAAKEFRTAVADMPGKAGLKRRLKAFEEVEPRLPVLRQGAFTKDLPGAQTEEGYVAVQHPLMEFANELGLGTGNVTSYGRTVYAISLAKSAASLQRALGTHLLTKPGPSEKDKQEQLTALASYAYLERVALEEYTSGARPQDVRLLRSEQGKAKDATRELGEQAKQEADADNEKFVSPPSKSKMVQAIGSGAGAGALKAQGITDKTWTGTATATFDAYRAVEKDLAAHAVEETDQIASDARRDMIVNSAVVVVALLIAFVLAGRMARAMSLSMRTLRGAAFDVAEQRLPMLVDQLSRTDPGQIDTRVKPIPITTRDEIGEVARAFDQVHREAVRLAAEQALLRGNVNAIFTNLSRRNQGLIERQLTLVTEMENNEADPDQLASLFKMDHLATRMRRNGENLLVLAGEEPGRRWTEPVPLVDVLRAAASEVEHYERIEISGVPESEIHGQVVNDLVHLLAELLENAASFSAPQSKVRVRATRMPDGRVMIEIHDKGIGLTAEDFADINHKLANPPTVDVAVAQRMGLFVVGRLADRHGIRVQLRPSGEQAGTTSLVMLPDVITHGGGGAEGAEEDFTVSRIVPEEQSGPPPQPGPRQPGPEPLPHAPTAAELGFDDSRYTQDGSGQAPLGPIGRSQRREEMRAALEAHQARTQRQELQPPQQQPPEPEQPAQPYPQQPGYGPEPYGQEPYGQQQTQPYPQPYEPAYGQQQADPYAQPYAQPREPQQGPYPEAYQEPHGALPQQIPQESYEEPPPLPQRPLGAGQYGLNGAEAESSTSAPEAGQDRVGFDRPDSLPGMFSPTTGAGLPRREPGRSQPEGGPAAQHQPHQEAPAPVPQQPRQQPSPEETGTGPGPGSGAEPGGRQPSENDDRWKAAGLLRAPQAGGVTSSGLPKRVPRANLVEGAAEESPQGGPSVSRAPEDVRGRLSNLHRGVRRGRTAGDANENDQQGFGPGSTYDQER
ncbi:nitrate- and nitrite sensing domain-containing protein [Streptomyces boncukensis]|uniref:histidine kinase n=1 Tax=Streptomyces boncukensis TaxID=2711219 RepID=A0A6G4X5J8_9ACTN|nr:HAMP domain-containing protein [Streptomyces boncukensis]